MALRRIVTIACLGMFFLGTSPSTLGAEQLTPAQMQGAAVVALDNGHPELAMAFAQALLSRNPNDLLALHLQARAARDLGQFDQATKAAQRAWHLSHTSEERYDSARIMAQTLASQGHRTRAQIWLRRAVQHAQSDHARTIAIRDFNYVRARNPLKLSLRFSASPESNINNGSIRSQTQIFDYFTQDYIVANLQGAALALSGYKTELGINLRYTLSETQNHLTEFLLLGDIRRYELSDSAKQSAPSVSANDFAYDNLDVGLMHRWRTDAGTEYQLNALAGGATYGGTAYSQRLRLDTGVSRRLSPRQRLRLTLGVEATRGPRAPHADQLRLGIDWTHVARDQGALSLFANWTGSRSDADAADYTEARVGIEVRPVRDVLTASASFGLSLRWRDYDSYTLFSPNGREDREASAYLSLQFRKLDYWGFTPTVTVSTSQTNSSIGLFDVTSQSVALGFASAF